MIEYYYHPQLIIFFTLFYRVNHTCELDKNLQCEYCDKSFNRQTNLKNHVQNVHSDIRMKCKFCTKTFGRKRRLKDHIIAYHEPVYCKSCNKKLRDKWEFKKHEVLVHKKMGKDVHICDVCPPGKNVFFSTRFFLRHCENKHSGSANIGEDLDSD